MRRHVLAEELGLVVEFNIDTTVGQQSDAEAEIEPFSSGAVPDSVEGDRRIDHEGAADHSAFGLILVIPGSGTLHRVETTVDLLRFGNLPAEAADGGLEIAIGKGQGTHPGLGIGIDRSGGVVQSHGGAGHEILVVEVLSRVDTEGVGVGFRVADRVTAEGRAVQ